jgi:glycerol-3-phosphate dehydrogenase
VAYLLEVANHAFPPAALQPDDVVSTFAGLRPLIATSANTTSATSREHEIRVERDGLITIMGGKLTTYRLMAEQAVDAAVESLRDHGFEGGVGPCLTTTRCLPGGEGSAPSFGEIEMAPDVEAHLRQSYGSRAREVVDLFVDAVITTTVSGADDLPRRRDVDLGSRIDPELPYLWAEVVHAARNELVVDVEDVLGRRIPLFRDARDQGLAAAPQAAALMATTLGWTDERRARSLALFQARVTESRAWRTT